MPEFDLPVQGRMGGGMRGGMGGGMRGGMRGFPGNFRFPRFPIGRFIPRFFPIIISPPINRCFTFDRFGRCCDRFGRCCDRFGRCGYIYGYNQDYDDGYPVMADMDEDMDGYFL